jgi:hypothetical protein
MQADRWPQAKLLLWTGQPESLGTAFILALLGPSRTFYCFPSGLVRSARNSLDARDLGDAEGAKMSVLE